ncbi:MAG: glycine cleavage system aminomethyltransferase GcvT [Ignavibacteriales bacterium]|nr:glycine cleavage system aminomethyltransferase GcvT [Ignavibacteriales bacterium]
MKTTSFHKIHKQLGAKLVEFAGFEMPVSYAGIIQEHNAVRNSVGVFDVSHMGEIEVRGRDAFAFVNYATTNDVSKLEKGKVQYSAMCYDDAGIVDDLLVYHCGDYIQLVVNASNKDKDFEWLKSNTKDFSVELIDRSDVISLLAIQGKNSLATLQKISSVDLSQLKYYAFTWGKIADVEALISRTGYTGELGFEIYFSGNENDAENLWDAIFEAGKEFNIQPCGLGARDSLRLEMGFCLYGNDIDKTTNPLEASLGWITKLNKGDFVGKNILYQQHEQGLKRKLVGFVLENERAIPRQHYTIQSNGKQVGEVTSGTISPTLGKGIGMGYVATEFSIVGNSIDVMIRNKPEKATIVKLPFIQK